MIPDEVVEQVQAAADIVAIISEHVRLKKVGSVYRGPCPFHQGTNANFSATTFRSVSLSLATMGVGVFTGASRPTQP